jgi:cell division protein FtsA
MLSKVIHARLVEIIDQVYLEVKNYGNDEGKKKLIAGIVLTGGGSQLKHIKQLFEYETGMDTRIGYPNEHLGKGDKPELESPMYATAIGLLMKGIEENEKHPTIEPIIVPVLDPTGASIDEVGGTKVAEPINEEPITESNATFFDKWVKGFMNFLANED